MNLPLRSLAVFAAGLLCIETCSAVSAGKASEAGNSMLASQQEAATEASSSQPGETVVIPGPLRPFLRMAGISQEASPAEVLPLLARNVSISGYENDKPTEYLILIDRYVHLARELQALAGADGTIRVAGCDDATRLIQVLGYQFQKSCGPGGAALVTADAERAFLTVDSGFPITALEEALQKGTPFSYGFPGTPVPVLFSEKAWTALSVANKKTGGKDLVDILLHDRSVDRLYSALAKSDRQTRIALMRSPGLKRLLPYAALLDFYGGWITIRNGQVAVPGGPGKEQAWKDLVGASPQSSGEFVIHLLAKDRGWLAAYFDAMSRIDQAQQAHFVEGSRLNHLYEAYRTSGAHDSRASASECIFPRNAGLLVLFTRLQWQPDGQPQVPGNLQIWRDILSRKPDSNGKRNSGANTRAWDSTEQLLDTLVASSISDSGINPLQIYLMLTAIDRGRPADSKLSEAAVRLLADRFPEFSSWYPVFAEFPTLDDASITHFVETADRINKTSNPTLRSNTLGAFQAEIGLWQILARQGQIPARSLNTSWQGAVQPYSSFSTSVQLFSAARTSLESTLVAAGGNAHPTQNELIDMLAGPTQNNPDGRRAHQELVRRIRAVMDDQRLVSLDSLIGLFDGLEEMAHGAQVGDTLVLLAADLREFEMPRPIFTGNEKSAWAPIVYSSRHAELQVRTDLTKIIRSQSTPAQLEDARGRLTPFLRDTLVGLNYAYYEPPGAQVLHNNPLFVRSHDFTASSVQGIEHVWSTPELVGVGVTAGGGAYLLGSLADLPYALASIEQDFIAPANIQALIWKEVVPELLVGAVLPRWWDIGQDELHAAALYQRTGEELLIASASDPQLRDKVLSILSDRMTPARLDMTAQALEQPDTAAKLLPQMMPADTFFLAAEFRSKFPAEAHWGNAGRELDELARKNHSHASIERLSKDFGLPHLALGQSDTCTLLNSGIFPVSGAFDGRLFGESWESSNLYWARLADETGYSPAMLNVLVPDLTRSMIANIFATTIDDWPALLRAMEKTGDQFREGRITVHGAGTITGHGKGTTTGQGAGTVAGQVASFPTPAAGDGGR
jgi:hypothetical protein